VVSIADTGAVTSTACLTRAQVTGLQDSGLCDPGSAVCQTGQLSIAQSLSDPGCLSFMPAAICLFQVHGLVLKISCRISQYSSQDYTFTRSQ
jgi:hypothetical protein